MSFQLNSPLQEPIRARIDGPKSEKIQRFIDIWRSYSEPPAGMPRKTSIDPIVLGKARLLPSVWLVDVAGVQSPVYRLAGEEINRIFGTSLRGKTVSDIFDREAARRVGQRWRRVIEGGLATYSAGHVYPDHGAAFLGERLALPLADDDLTPRYVLGITDYILTTDIPEPEKLGTFDTPVTYFVRTGDF